MVGSRSASKPNMRTKDGSGDRNIENLEAPGKKRKYSNLKITTQFQNRVYDACKCIPPGKVGTYGVIASALQSSPRAVGQALRRNPFAPKVPCHRVITSSMELGGFGGSWGIETDKVKRKRQMLGAEGVVFDDQGRLVSKASLMTLPELIQAMSRVKKSSKQSQIKE